MVLIIGGAYQGKHDCQREQYPIRDGGLVDDLHLWVRQRLETGGDPLGELKDRLDSLRDKVIICEDISCGVVPVDSLDRQWRETTGRCAALLASRADRVVRVFCGIPTIIK